ncbi:MAG: glycerophosphodiester phosphodiesterase [Rhodospirillales bacterium]|jgi:glycerophosphoryl diester phosphodiesterase|nr:glycerophosphodiester phosphodiesterase [Rhodospirillales bacterium]
MTHRPVLIGHRGARGLFPENTLEGFAAAAALGIDGIELDVALTADGVPVLSHDPALNPALTRGPDGGWIAAPGPLIRTLTAASLAAYDVGRLRPGSALAATFPDQCPIDGARIPHLAAALAAPGDAVPEFAFIVELKTMPDHPDWTAPAAALAEAALAAAAAAGALARVTFESFDWRGPRHLRHLRPDLRLAWLTCPQTVAAAALWWDGPRPEDFGGSVPRAVAAEGGAVWAPEHADLSAAEIAEAHALGLAVYAWTVNRPEDMARLIGWGIDGLITDRPDHARRVMAELGLPLPPAGDTP